MKKTLGIVAAGMLLLTGCEAILDGAIEVGQLETDLDYATLERQAYRAYAASYSETPFENGPVSVVASDHGEMRTFRLVPCRSGAAICAGSAQGAVGRLELTPDYAIVSGLYGRTFWLSPGGDGAVVRGAQTEPLAWN